MPVISDLSGLLLGTSFTAGIAVLVVMSARLVLKKAPKRWSYIMWAVVFFRCLCPFSAESSISVFNIFRFGDSIEAPSAVVSETVVPYTEGDRETTASVEYTAADTEDSRRNDAIKDMQPDSQAQGMRNVHNVQNVQNTQALHAEPSEQIQQTNDTVYTPRFIIVWLCGVGAMALYGIVSAARLSARVRTAVKTEKGIYESDRISTAFAAGILRPKIYIPCGIPEDERRLIIMHERVHIRRRDYLFKLLAFAGLSLHWFNPLIWTAFVLMTRDMEMSCDEAVLKKCGESGRILYAEALLRVSVKGFGGAAAVGFGETGIKERVKNVLNYKKPGKLAAAAAAMVMLASCTMAGTDAVDSGREDISSDGNSANSSAAAGAAGFDADNESNGADGKNTDGSGSTGNTEADDVFDLSRMSEFFDRCITLSAREPFVVIGSPEVDGYSPKNVWLIPIDRTGGITGMGAENFIIDDDGVVTATFRVHCGDRKVASPADGEVLWSDETCVVLDTEYGAVTYGDMREVTLKAGDKVVKGEPLGRTAGVGYAGYAVQASMSIFGVYRGVNDPITSIYYRASVSNGAYTYTSSESRFLGDNADAVRLLETADIYEKTPWYDAGDGGKELHGNFISRFMEISDMTDGEVLRKKQKTYDRLQEESRLQRLREEEERLKDELRQLTEEAASSANAEYPAIENLELNDETYYLISTEEQLRAVAAGEYGMDKNYMQQSDIQLSSDEWIPIGTKENPFTGSYNGNGFEITGLTMKDPDAVRVGMFGYAEKANIYNITLRDYDIESAGRNAPQYSSAPILPVVTGGTRCYDNHVYPVGSAEIGIRFVKPCPQDAKITEVYGTGGVEGVHKGIDYGVDEGTEVYAAADGRVIANSDEGNGYGICVIIEHEDGFTTVYAHLSEAIVDIEDEVKAGDLIGYSGGTGYAFGNHLHFEVRDNGQHVDPMLYIKN